MGLLSKAFAVGVGYVLAHPEVRQKIVAVGAMLETCG